MCSSDLSGLKLNLQANLTEGITYKVLLDFDAGKSIVARGNNTFLLKPVVRAISEATTGAIKGSITPLESNPGIYALNGTDTVATTFPDADGKFLADAGTKDAFGHTQLGGAAPEIARIVKEGLGYKYHWAVADYLQRAARHIASKTDVDQAYAVGKAAVEYAVKGQNAVLPVIVRKASRPYRWEIRSAPIEAVANVEKKVPRNFVTADGFGITAACRRYLEPLIAGEDYPPFKNGLPDYIRLRNAPVRRKLKTDFKV